MPKAPSRPAARFERIAHRGAPREQVENTLPGFLRALEHGADALELDVHATSDGIVVVHHDDEVHGHVIAKCTWHDVARFDLGSGATIPRLDDVLRAVGDRAAVYIELKGFRIEERVIEVAREHGRRFALHSFDHDAIARVAKRAPEIPRGILLDREIPRPLEQLRDAVDRIHPRDVWPHWTLIDANLIQLARELDTRVITWTVNSEKIARSLVEYGADGLCTDDVRLLANL